MQQNDKSFKLKCTYFHSDFELGILKAVKEFFNGISIFK